MVISTALYWVRKSRDSGRNLDLNNQMQCGTPVSAVLSLNSKTLTNSFNKIDVFLREPYQKRLVWLVSMILLQVWVTKECVLDGFHVSLHMK